MYRLLAGAAALISVLLLVAGCGSNAGTPPSADEAARQSAITQQGAVNAPAPGGAPGTVAPAK